jgi:hypothetical protein
MLLEVGRAVRSAVSNDGLVFTMESGIRLSDVTHVRVIQLADGRHRVYYRSRSSTEIQSSISTDEGLTWTPESGIRLSAAAAGVATVSGVSVVRMPDGKWRMYFSEAPASGFPPPPRRTFSAWSDDLLTWTMDPGVRVGPGATLAGSAEHPAVLANPDGSISIFYFRNNPTQLLTATSTDGLTFSSETIIFQQSGPNPGSPENDPDVVRLPDGTIRMYYGTGNESGGAIHSARRTGAALDGGRTLALLNRTAAAASTRQPHLVQALTNQVLDSVSPLYLPQRHSLRERIARAEEDFRLGRHLPISEAAAVEAFNRFVNAIGAPPWAQTDPRQFRAVRSTLQIGAPQLVGTVSSGGARTLSTDMSPVEGIFVTLSLAASKLTSPSYQVTVDTWLSDLNGRSAVSRANQVPQSLWTLYRPVIEHELANESSQLTQTAHDLLTALGLRR